MQGCEDLWFNVHFPRNKLKYIFGIIYRYPRNDVKTFIEALDANLQAFKSQKRQNVYFW